MNSQNRPVPAPKQLRLELRRHPRHERADFIVSDANAEAVAAVDAWPSWPGGALALIGPEGAGKTHLARAWAVRSGATILEPGRFGIADLPHGPILLEDADVEAAGEMMFHLINRAEAEGGLLVTARHPPRVWPTELPDLRSRLNALHVADLGAPDDAILEGAMLNLFRERNIRPDPDLLPYLLRRIERSVPGARAVVERLDEAGDAAKRNITRALAREILETSDPTGDLFD